MKMSSKTDIRAFFNRKRAAGSDGPTSKKNKPSNQEIIVSATEIVNRGEIQTVMDEVEKSTARQNYNSVPKLVRIEVGKYALRHSTKDALDHFSKKYPKYKFKRTSVNSWKASLKTNENDKPLKKIGRPNLLSDELLTKTKDVIIGSRLAGTVISRRMVIAIGTGVVKANDPGIVFIF